MNAKFNAWQFIAGLTGWLAVLGAMAACMGAAPAAHLELGANVNGSLTQLDPALLTRSRTTWVRGFVPMSEFISGRRSLTSDAGLKALQAAAHAGRKVIVSLKWDLKEADWRVPAPDSATEKKWFAGADALLDQLRGKMAQLSLVNEVFVDTPPDDLKPAATGRIPMVDFLQRLAHHVAERRPKAADGQPLPLFGGGLTRLDTAAMQASPAVQALLQWCAADPDIAGVDVHLHQRNYEQFERALTFLRQQVPAKPVIVTEFSLVWEYKAHLNEPLAGDAAGRVFATRHQLGPELSTRDYINLCLAHPVAETQWNDFLLSRSWFDPDFLKRTCDLMARHGVTVATYALTQKGPGMRPLGPDATPWLLNPIFVPSTAQPAAGNPTAVNTPWFNEYLGRQPQ